MLQGYKVYIVCATAILYAGVSIWNGSMDMPHAIDLVLAALGAAGFRSAMKKGN
ncbi:MAG: hypothetical protein ACREEE_12755 [Dongiaceae bacterium]